MKITAEQLADVISRLPHPAHIYPAPYIRVEIRKPGPGFPYPDVTATEASKHTLVFRKAERPDGLDAWAIEIGS